MEYINNFIIAVVMLLGLGVASWVFISNRSLRVNQLFLFLVGFPLFNVFFTYLSQVDPSRGLIWSRFAWFMGSLAMVAFYYFVIYFPRKIKSFPLLNILVMAVWSFFASLSIFTNYIVEDVQLEDSITKVIPGSLMDIFYLSFIIFSILVLFILFKKYFLLNNIEKRKIKYFVVGLLLFISTSVTFSIILPAVFGIERLTFVGDYSIIVFFGMTAYVIVKHRLFDIRFAVIRAVTYALSLGVTSGLYFLLAFVSSKFIFGETASTFSRGPADFGLLILLSLSFQPIKHFFDRITNQFFFKDNYNAGDFFTRLNRVVTLTTDIHGLLASSAIEIASTIKTEQAYFVVVKQNGRMISVGTQKHTHIPRDDINAIDKYIVNRGRSPIVKALLTEDKTEKDMSRLMQSHKTEIIVPLLLSNQRVGYLCLGDKKSSNFNNRDISTLEAAADELTIAIKDALAVQEIRELNETLQQRIANATKELRTSNTMLRHLDKAKDEFVSMASHQLRTPLTSIKGYISMVIEGDAGKISDMQKQLLNEAFISSERMVHLINDFLNVSRIQTGKFIIDRSPVDLSKVVEQEIDSLQSSAVARNLKYKYTKPKNFPILDVDEGKLRQVIMNFADNALYYSHENTVIEVDLSVDGKEIIYTVKDTGIGVPKAEQDHLFTKFFRATNAKVQRPDGTGVGLYLAKRIINGHGGKVVFKSVEGKGSTFGFRLPIEPIL